MDTILIFILIYILMYFDRIRAAIMEGLCGGGDSRVIGCRESYKLIMNRGKKLICTGVTAAAGGGGGGGVEDLMLLILLLNYI